MDGDPPPPNPAIPSSTSSILASAHAAQRQLALGHGGLGGLGAAGRASLGFVASSGGALTLALLCNKALLPERVPITIALTPPVARALSRWRLVKS
ncbi:uncharacterized protein LOC101785749 [Setaria italica]|uniref:uncharacterized protein LOC101785749 n=1 Tax=Setaria italica TaxID=4555 RepID=UPI000350882E|nr:uncharacterized protein LOC101785749 [Setaria italica]